MRCNKAREYLSLEIDGVQPPDSLQELQQHLDSCADCLEYREDLLLGQRLLAATEPELPENFEWKLRLKLNQTIREAAGRADYPWQEERVDRWRWFRNFGSAAAVVRGSSRICLRFLDIGRTANYMLPPSSRKGTC